MENNNVKIIPSSQTSWIRGNCIGQGSFASVYCARMKSSGDIFAVKSADCQYSRSTSQVESVENEIRILKSLSSFPYIVKYLGDDLTQDSTSTIIQRNLHLEYLTGGTVADLRGAKNERVIQSYTYCILSALNYLHSKRIVHCDVKGKNILIGHVPGTCKLADFGSAIDLSDPHPNELEVITRGSPLWMAPEVVRQEYQGTESDIWSLGCTVIEMITGKPAWKGEGGVNSTLYKIGYSDELPEFPVQLSECGRDFLTKCLIRDRNERWSCYRLLQHPFVSQIPPIVIQESSPRSVLDFIDNKINDEDEDETIERISDTQGQIEVSSARMRISELATSTGANWESESWTVVRGEGTNSEYSESVGEIMVDERAKLERLLLRLFRNACVVDGELGKCRSVAGWSCSRGVFKMMMIIVALTYTIIRFYYFQCSLKLLLLLLLYLMMMMIRIILLIFSCLFYLIGELKSATRNKHTDTVKTLRHKQCNWLWNLHSLKLGNILPMSLEY